MAPTRTLREILDQKIASYLMKDNPVDSVKRESARFFCDGLKDRESAQFYQKKIALIEEGRLLERVYQDLVNTKTNNTLGLTRKLRDRLLDGICEYSNIKNEDIQGQLPTTREDAILTLVKRQIDQKMPHIMKP